MSISEDIPEASADIYCQDPYEAQVNGNLAVANNLFALKLQRPQFMKNKQVQEVSEKTIQQMITLETEGS